jgi:hypothetical protein
LFIVPWLSLEYAAAGLVQQNIDDSHRRFDVAGGLARQGYRASNNEPGVVTISMQRNAQHGGRMVGHQATKNVQDRRRSH